LGWGQEPHEGWADRKFADGTWRGPTTHGSEPDPVAVRAACSCGWHSEREHKLPQRPEEHQAVGGSGRSEVARQTWLENLSAADDACWEDWRTEHYSPLLGYEPDTLLILGRTEGGLRHFLNGEPVHAGARLELQLDGGNWLPVRYEWSFSETTPPMAYVALALPEPAQGIAGPPLIQFALPTDAILRWPQR
jgi:hypothetical protein